MEKDTLCHVQSSHFAIIGSASKNELTPASDCDLLAVLSDKPIPLHGGLTYIDQCLTNIIFLTVTEVDHLWNHPSDEMPKLRL